MLNPKNERFRRHASKKRAIIQEHKDKPCADCGVKYPPYVMDFDHRNPEDKELTIANVAHHGMQKLLDEIEKCDVVCANCHRIRTHNRRSSNGRTTDFDSVNLGSNPSLRAIKLDFKTNVCYNALKQ